MKEQARDQPRRQDNHSGMVALRSIDEQAAGWYRAYGAACRNKPGPFTVAGAALVFHQTSHLIPASFVNREPEAGRILKRWGGKVNERSCCDGQIEGCAIYENIWLYVLRKTFHIKRFSKKIALPIRGSSS